MEMRNHVLGLLKLIDRLKPLLLGEEEGGCGMYLGTYRDDADELLKKANEMAVILENEK